MGCWRFRRKGTFVLYLEGSLPSGAKAKLEKHLQTCDSCRARFALVQSGLRAAQRLPHVPWEGADSEPRFEAIFKDAGGIGLGRRRWSGAWERRFDALITPRAVWILLALVLVQSALLAVTNRRLLFGERPDVAAKPADLDFSRFEPLAISDLQSNTKPHIAIEGFVRDIRVDTDERTLHFRLTETPSKPGPFIVCEILNPNEIVLPREGSRVRVYGVARFDPQAGRQWHEVNPVLDIAVLKR